MLLEMPETRSTDDEEKMLTIDDSGKGDVDKNR
jgi:hypothetical protein